MAPDYIRRHLRIGGWSLPLCAASGLALELLQAFKVGWYLDVPSDTWHLMWTLTHAHGMGLLLAHVAFAATLHALPARTAQAGSCAVT
jgi:hypothetical protein